MLVPRMLVPEGARITGGNAGSPFRSPVRRASLFAESLLENSPTKAKHRPADFVISVVAHTVLLGAVLLVPLYFTEALDLHGFTRTMLVAPPVPAPPPPPAAAVARPAIIPKKLALSAAKLIAPRAIPNHIVRTVDASAAPDAAPGNSAGVPGGVPGGQPGGVIGGILSGASGYVPPPPVALIQPRRPVRIGGAIKEPRLIARVDPVYPLLLQRARVESEVVIDAVVDAQGNVVQMQPVSGHRLLIASAMEALRQWKYEPTILNGEAIPVELRVTFTFRVKPVS
jgi:periplasmic protein TonB